jgi:hypothetical protein
MPLSDAEFEAWPAEFERDLQAALAADDEDDEDVDPPPGVPLSDAPGHVQTTFFTRPKPRAAKRRRSCRRR